MKTMIQATQDNIKVGTTVHMHKVQMLITEETPKHYKGYHTYRNKRRGIILSKSTLTNPHYMHGIKVEAHVHNIEVLMLDTLTGEEVSRLISIEQLYNTSLLHLQH